jgi:hypothetical protein
VDFQVEAMIGYTHRQVTGGMVVPWVFAGETSGWSNTHTVTIGESQTPTPSPAATPSPTHYTYPDQYSELELIIGAVIVATVIGAGLGLLIYLIKRK